MLDHVFGKMDRLVAFSFSLFGCRIEVGNAVVVTWVISAVLIVLAFAVTRNLSVEEPGRVQLLAEALVRFVNGLCGDAIEQHSAAFAPYICTVLLYITLSNIIGLFNFIPGLTLYPPTKDINVTGALAVMSILVILYAGFRYQGPRGVARSLISPVKVMLPFKLMEYFTRPLSLCLRLVGNIIAGFVIVEMVLEFIPLAAAPFSAYFDLFDGVLQAYIFIYLTTLYIGEAVEAPE